MSKLLLRLRCQTDSLSNLFSIATIWDSIIGQDRPVDQLRHAGINPVHAFLLIGPEGCGKEEAARAFAAHLLSDSDELSERTNDLVMRGAHPDVHEIRRTGASILTEQAEEAIKIASITPTEGNRKVIIMHEVELMAPGAAARLLKTVEEPPTGVFFIMLSDQINDSLVTIASRCMIIHFGLLSTEVITAALINGGSSRHTAEIAARSARGSLSRARILATDPQLVQRREFFANIPRRIDGTGATVAAIVEQILGLIDGSSEPLVAFQEQEIANLDRNLVLMGVKRGGKKQLEERHKRELRRHRTEELRAGLTEVAGVYRDELALNAHIHRPEAYITAVTRIHEAMRHLSLNINEAIMLRDLIWSLPSPSADAALQFVLSENN